MDVLSADDYEKALMSFHNQKIDESYIHLKNVLKNSPDNLPAKILMAKVLLHKNNYAEGIDLFQEALVLGADINLLLNDLGNALMVTGDYQQVVDLGVGQSLTKANQLTWRLLSGNAYALLKQSEQARKAYQQALTLSPNSFRALSALAAFELEKDNLEAAEKIIKKIVIVYAGDSRSWKLKGDLHDKKGEKTKALTAFETGYQLSPSDPFIQRSLAHAYTSIGKFNEALLIVDKILTVTPDDSFAQLLKSQLLAETDQNEASLELLTAISEKLSRLSKEQQNTNVSLAYVAGTAAFVQNNYELAQNKLQFYVNQVPDDLNGLNMLLSIFLQQQQTGKALDLLESKERLIKDDLRLSLKLFNLYLNNKKLYKAERILLDLEERFLGQKSLVLARVNWYLINQRYDEATALLKKYQPKEFDGGYSLTQGLVYRAQSRFNEASKIADNLLVLDDKNTDYLAFKGILLLQQRQWQSAVEIFESILKIEPEDFNAQYNLATALAAIEKHAQAKELTTKLLSLYPDYLPLKVLNAKIQRDTGNVESAIDILKSIVSANSTYVDAIKTLLDIYYNEGKFEDALFELDKLTKISFLNPEYISKKAQIYIGLQQFDNAIKQLNILLGIIENPQEFYRLALLQIQAGDRQGAQKSLEHTLTLQPENLLFRLELTKLYLALNNLTQAHQQIVVMEKGDKNNPNVLLLRADYLVKKGSLNAAQGKYLKALKLDNNFQVALTRLYQLAVKGVGQESFKKTLLDILVSKPEEHFMRTLLADYLLSTGDLSQAKAQYEILVNVDSLPNKASVYNNLANIFISSDLDSAEKYAKLALSLDNSSASIADTYGWVLGLQGKTHESLTILRKAFSMNSGDPSISYHIAYILNVLNRVAEAKIEVINALALDIAFPEQADAEKLLQTLSNNN
jgi:putative PEP-CTERM system TPR-repeat lipoprotein